MERGTQQGLAGGAQGTKAETMATHAKVKAAPAGPSGHSVFVCAVHLSKAGATAGQAGAARLAGQLHAALDHSLRVYRWRSVSSWTLISSYEATPAKMSISTYLVVERKATRRNDNVYGTWKRVVASRFTASGVDIGGAVRGAWADVDGKGLAVLIDCVPRQVPYADALEELRTKLDGKQTIASDETAVVHSIGARAM